MAHHDLKTDPEAFQPSADGVKNFEIRFDDRDFKPGDHITLHETQYSGEEMKEGKPLIYTGRSRIGEISYVLHGGNYGLMEGWVILAV